jgi:hypothetical protein
LPRLEHHIVGHLGSDVLIGDAADKTITALGGNDVLRAMPAGQPGLVEGGMHSDKSVQALMLHMVFWRRPIAPAGGNPRWRDETRDYPPSSAPVTIC